MQENYKSIETQSSTDLVLLSGGRLKRPGNLELRSFASSYDRVGVCILFLTRTNLVLLSGGRFK